MSGEKPGDYSIVQKELKKRNYINYIDYVNDICKLTLKNKILPHLNIGILTYDELKRLKDNTVSMGLMLESSSQKLMERGCVHESSPGKAPKIRIKHIKEAGKLKIPFTTGLLIGIGESLDDRIKDLLLIKELNDQYNHIQEVIIQNFKEKKNVVYSPQKKIQMKDLLKIVGIARVIFKNQISIQIPPNLTENLIEFFRMGVNDLGGISPFSVDYINPEKKWPQVSYLQSLCRKNGYILKERLAVYRKFLNRSKFINKKVLNLIKEIYNSSKFI
jgi:FO synthase subunit 1